MTATVMDKTALIEASKDSLNDDFDDRETVESFRAPLPDLSAIKFKGEGDKLTKDEKKLLIHFQQLNNLRKIKKDLQAQVLKVQEEKKRKAEQEKTKKAQSSNNTTKLASAVQAKERAKLLLQSGAIKLPQARRANFIQHKRGMAQRKGGSEETPLSPDKLSPDPEGGNNRKAGGRKDGGLDGTPPKRPRLNAAGRPSLYDNFVSGGRDEGSPRSGPNSASPQVSVDSASPNRLDSPRFRNHQPDRTGNVLYVRGCSLTNELLTHAFQEYGPIISINVDSEKGHGFVTLESADMAKAAIDKVVYCHGITLRVEFARKQTQRSTNPQRNVSRRDLSTETWSNFAARGKSNADYRPKQEVVREMVKYD